MKKLAVLSLAGMLTLSVLASFHSTSSRTTSLDTLKIPDGVDPNDENWKGIDLAPKTPVQPLTIDEQLKKFLVPEGYKMQAVLTEPQIQQPAEIVFDGNGRMYVLELRSYMLDADSKNELEPTSRISRWEDKNNDGIYETGTAFVDGLIFPRFVLPYGKNSVLTMESDQDNIYKYTDTNGDGKADKKEFFTNKYGRSGNVEHQQAFLFYGMDNWLYSTVNAFRIRETPNGIIREKTGANRAQWGITQDDDGKLYFQGGASGVPSHFQFPIQYGNFEVPNELAAGFVVPYGAAVKVSDMQGGMDEIRQPDGSLNRVTGSAGNDIFRGDRLPASVRGQLFYGEPVARIVRQINPIKKDGLTTLHNVFQDQKSEFIRSTDPLFRPIDMATAPDGTMYIVDMYHGIIQEGQWTPKGSYLRTKIEQYKLDKVVGLGRIWRVSHEGFQRDTKQPRMYDDKSATLVTYLNHPNGWWQDMAQQVLVQRNDKSVVPALTAMALKGTNVNGRIHAIWTLEGLGSLKVATVTKLMADVNPRIRIQALKASETLYKAGEKGLAELYKKALNDSDNEVVMQAIFTQKFLKVPELESGIKATLASNKSAGVKLIGEQIITPPKPRTNGPFNAPELSKEQKGILERGELVFAELCSQCHGNDGMGKPMGNGKLLAPALAGSFRIQQHPEYSIRVILHGLEGAIDGKTYAGGLMQPMKEQSDQWIADVVSYIRNGLSNDASFVTPQQVASIRANTNKQAGMYKFEALLKQVPMEFVPDQSWKFYATHTSSTRVGGNASPKSAFNYEGWSTGKTQEKDMVFQVEFPSEYTLSEFHFTSTSGFKRGQRPAAGVTPEFTHTYPRNLQVEASTNGSDWQVVQANVKGTQGDNIVSLTPTRTKFLRLKLAEGVNAAANDITPWSMRSMKIYGLR